MRRCLAFEAPNYSAFNLIIVRITTRTFRAWCGARAKTFHSSCSICSIVKYESTSLDVLCVQFQQHQSRKQHERALNDNSAMVQYCRLCPDVNKCLTFLISYVKREASTREHFALRPLNFIYFNNRIITVISSNHQLRLSSFGLCSQLIQCRLFN